MDSRVTGAGTPEIIAQGFAEWLRAEVVSSTAADNRNKYLDDLTDVRRSPALPVEDPANKIAGKTYSHLSRLPHWWEAYTYDPSDDFQSGRILFSPLMLISGAYRNQCYVQASDQEDYLSRRSSPVPVGIDIGRIITARLVKWFDTVPPADGFAEAPLNLNNLEDGMQESRRRGELALQVMCRRAQESPDFGQEESETVLALRAIQQTWLEFGTDLVTYAAKIRGGRLAAVPFLEAKSISDEPQVYYPFARVA